MVINPARDSRSCRISTPSAGPSTSLSRTTSSGSARGTPPASHGQSQALSADAEVLSVSVDGRSPFLKLGALSRADDRGAPVRSRRWPRTSSTPSTRSTPGLVSKADVMRLEAQGRPAPSRPRHRRKPREASPPSSSGSSSARRPKKPLNIGIDIFRETAALPPEDLGGSERASAEEAARESARWTRPSTRWKRVEDVTAANYLPRVDAFADGLLGNPNPHYFLPTQTWNFHLGGRRPGLLDDQRHVQRHRAGERRPRRAPSRRSPSATRSRTRSGSRSPTRRATPGARWSPSTPPSAASPPPRRASGPARALQERQSDERST